MRAAMRRALASCVLVLLCVLEAGCGSSSDPKPESTLAYEEFSDAPEVARIVRVAADGSHRKVLWEGDSHITPLYPASDGRMLFQSNTGWVMLTPGGEAAPFSAPTVGSQPGVLPVWSPDGSTIAWLVVNPDPVRASIALAAAGSSSAQVIVPDSLNVQASIWSPDSQQLALCAYASGNSLGLFVIDREGDNLHRLTGDYDVDCHMSWSPTGRIAFNAGGGVYTIMPDGTDMQPLISTPLPSFVQMLGGTYWAPNGVDATTTDNSELMWHIVGSSGAASALMRQTPYANPWSPDGELLAYRSDTTRIVDGVPVGHYTVGVMRADGSEPRTITSDSVDSFLPVWLPDAS